MTLKTVGAVVVAVAQVRASATLKNKIIPSYVWSFVTICMKVFFLFKKDSYYILRFRRGGGL
nr:hypothetical protein [Anaeromicrobium sediminis]